MWFDDFLELARIRLNFVEVGCNGWGDLSGWAGLSWKSVGTVESSIFVKNHARLTVIGCLSIANGADPDL